jgi:predicted metalloprotease
MTQQQWGRQPARGQFGRQFGSAPQGWQQPAQAQGWMRAPGQFGGQQSGPQGWQQPGRPAPGNFRPPHQRNPLRAVLVAVMMLVAAALVALIIVNLATGSSNHTVAYQNDNYKVPPPDLNPPPLPEPQTYDEAKRLTTSNQLYHQKMPLPVRCELKPITGQSTDPELKTHLNGLMACLVRAWEPPVTAAGYQIVRPSVTIYGDSITTKCGKAGGGNAFYCPADQQVYYSRTLPDVVADLKGSKWGPDIVLAHEFGHAVQARTGILVSADGLEQQAGVKSAAGLEMSRRIEQQADCFSGLFLRATSQSLGIRQSDVPAMEVIFVAIGDDTLSNDPTIESTHGHGVDRLYWARRGLGSSAVSQCNTFTAPSSRVK